MSENPSAPEGSTEDQIVPPELIEEYLRIRKSDIAASKVFYFDQLMPRIRPWIEAKPEHERFRAEGYATLVSLMGFSPETTVTTALILRPKRLVIAYSENAQDAARPALDYLIREGVVDHFGLEHVRVNAFNPSDIYEKIHKALPQSERMIFDITGGTKVMSATAGALAWELNLTLCYLEGAWDPNTGSAGLKKSSRLTVIPNPSRSWGYQIRGEALENYERGNFPVAADGFRRSRELIDDSHFDHLALDLCRCYCNLADFDREGLSASIDRLEETLSMGGVRRLHENRLDIRRHLDALRLFARRDPMAMTAAFVVLSEMYSRQGRNDFAGLLTYRAMESLVEDGFRRLSSGFKMAAPVWEELTPDVQGLRDRYSRLSPTEDAELPSRVTLQSGFGLLCALDDLTERVGHHKDRNAVGQMMGLAKIRNSSYMAHGYEKLSDEQSRELRDQMEILSKAILRDDHAEFEVLYRHLGPLPLRELASV